MNPLYRFFITQQGHTDKKSFGVLTASPLNQMKNIMCHDSYYRSRILQKNNYHLYQNIPILYIDNRQQ
jgi:hypothetical protein